MQRKTILVTFLVFVLIGLCLLMLLSLRFIFGTGFIPVISSMGNQFSQSSAVATIEEHETVPVDSPARLIIENPFGNVKLTGYSGNEITIDIVKRAWGIDPNKAHDCLEKTQVEVNREGKTVKINVIPEQNPIGIVVNVDFVISVPVETTIDTTIRNGDIDLSHLEAEASLHSDFGDIHVADLESGALTASSRNGTVTVMKIKSHDLPLVLHSDFGDVQLVDSNSSGVDIQTKNGTVALENVEASGPVSLSSDFGSIYFKEGRTGTFNAFSRNGEIRVKSTIVEGSLTIQTDFGDINLDRAEAISYDLQNKNGLIFVDTASGSLLANSDFGEIKILNGHICDLTLKTKNGDIKYEGSLGTGPHNLTTDFGDISLTVPFDSTMDIDAQTAFGDIDNSFEITTRGKLNENNLVGKINGGGTSVKLKTSNGTIRLDSMNIKEQ